MYHFVNRTNIMTHLYLLLFLFGDVKVGHILLKMALGKAVSTFGGPSGPHASISVLIAGSLIRSWFLTEINIYAFV